MNLVVSFRGQQIKSVVAPGITIAHVKQKVLSSNHGALMTVKDVKLMHRGKILSNDQADLYETLFEGDATLKTKKKTVKLIAMGVSKKEELDYNREMKEGIKSAPRIRDDLSDQGKLAEARRKHAGMKVLRTATSNNKTTSNKYGFHGIETLPMLPNAKKAREILTLLSNDPGILACMNKHKWNVGCLAELYPKGQVGQSDVCVMGLNQNKGQKILLRLRTDDLKGFRKILSIRKVLFHELAHNVHSEHDTKFFQLMRQIENECNDLNWTMGTGRSIGGSIHERVDQSGNAQAYNGSTSRLGGHTDTHQNLSLKELSARAALQRLSHEDLEIQRHCGCGREADDDL